MDGAEVLQPESDQVFRLAYTSRAVAKMPRDAVVCLARDAAANNRRTEVTGVLLADAGVFVQWLEGPKAHVDALMARIATDPRHRDVSVLSAGWAAERRFPDWPMQLAGSGLTPDDVRTTAGPPVDADRAMRAFDRAAALRSRAAAAIQRNASDAAAADVEEFAERLATCASTQLPEFPTLVLEDLGRRARWVDAVCGIFARGWQDDVWSSAEVVLGLAHLNCLWQRAGRVPEPIRPLGRVAVVVPPGSHEMIGAIVKADLLRAGGTSVRIVLEPDPDAALGALTEAADRAIIVAGPRVGLSRDAERAAVFADRARDLFGDREVLAGGRAFGPLCAWQDRWALARARLDGEPAGGPKSAEVLARRALAHLGWP